MVKIIKINSRTLTSGTKDEIKVFHFSGNKKNAKSIYIQSCIHGAEVQGYLVAIKLIDFFKKNKPNGDVVIVPIANPYGLNCKIGDHTFGRFDPLNGLNWNRNYVDNSGLVKKFLKENNKLKFNELIIPFKKIIEKNLINQKKKNNNYGQKLAIDLQILASKADIVLDLHCDTISIPHVYSPSYALNSSAKFKIPFVIEIPHKFNGALDEAIFCPWISLMNYYNKLHPDSKINYPHVESYTLELGDKEHINIKNIEEQYQNILNYLAYHKICNLQNTNNENNKIITCKLKDFKMLLSPYSGIIIDNIQLGKLIKANKSILKINMPQKMKSLTKNSIEYMNKNITYKKDSIPITKPCTAIIQEGMLLSKLMTNYKEIN